MKRRRPKLKIEVGFVPTEDGFPPGDHNNPYRYMDEEEREAILMTSFVRILRECAAPPEAPPAAPPSSESP